MSHAGTQADAGTSEAEAPARELTIDTISVTGLSPEEARNKLLDTYQWGIQLSYEGKTEPIENPLPDILDSSLSEIYSQDASSRKDSYTLDFLSPETAAPLETNIRAQVTEIAAKWDRLPAKTQLTGRDKESGNWIYTNGKNGIKVNQEAAVQAVLDLIRKKSFAGTVTVQIKETAPEYSVNEIKEKYQVIGTFSTTATANSSRNNNISLAMNALDGLVIFPGEEFSFNKTTGNRTTERGYMPAGAYRNGQFVEEPGGGVCQVSSTLYNAIIFSGIKTKERHPHSFEPSYVTPGEDAMVSYDGYSGPDLRFVNKQDTSVAIRAVFKDNKLTISIIGIPILEKGVEVSMRSEKIKEYDPPTPEYEEDQTLQPGQEIVVREGVKGTTWKTWLITSKDGKVITEDYFHSSTYKGKAGLVKRNTSEVMIPGPEEEGAQGHGGTPAAETSPVGTAPTETSPEGSSQAETSPGETPQAGTSPGGTSPAETLPGGTPQGGTSAGGTGQSSVNSDGQTVILVPPKNNGVAEVPLTPT